MNIVAKLLPVISILALVAIFALGFALLAGSISRDSSNTWMLVCSIVWFATAPLWIGREKA